MAGTSIVEIKRALRTAFQALPALQGVTVDWSYVAKHHEGAREYIYFGARVEGAITAAAMAGGSRFTREENAALQLHINVTALGEQDTEKSEARAVAIGIGIEEYLAGNWRNEALGLLAAKTAAFELESGINDDGAVTVLTYTFQLQSHMR